MFLGRQIFLGRTPKKIWRPKKTSNCRRGFQELCDLIADTSGTQQDIVSPIMVLHTTIITVNFCPQTEKIGA